MPLLDDATRRALFVWALQHVVATVGGTVQVQGPFDAIVLGKETNHVIHIILTLLTVGFWLPIWLLVAMTSQRRTYIVAVDPEGVLTIYDRSKQRHMQLSPHGVLTYV